MITTIDKAGRVVIPAAVRAKAGFRPGTQLEVILEGNEVRLMPAVPRPRLVQRGQRWIAAPTAAPDQLPQIDVAALVQQERDRWPT